MSVSDMRGAGAKPPSRGSPRFLRNKRTVIAGLAAVALTMGLTLPLAVSAAASISSDSGFESADGNLKVDSTFDWNGFSPVTWTGTAPYQTANTTVNGFKFTGLTDAQKSNTDTGFAGGTKQDKNCPSVIGTSAPNKDDLKRIYISHKTVNINGSPHIFLQLAWVRIPQNTTSPSAHVGFEFNQSTTQCPSGSDGLVQRTAGDMLIVYDFNGGSTDVPTLTVRRWVTTPGTACDISSDSPPCWGVAKDLSASGFAEAKVNTSTVGSVCDALAPGSNNCTGNNPTETLGLNEFGEAGIDLTAAGIFSSTQCTSFGQAEGVSRSSGNSGQAAMEDLVGPGSIRISNCGTLNVKKVTDPSPDPTNTSFSFTKNGSNNPTTLPRTFSLKNGETDTETVFAANDFSVQEAVPTNWTLTSASCDNGSGTLDNTTSTLSGITVAPDENVTCTFFDHLQQGALQIQKNSTKGGPVTKAGAQFSYTDSNGVTKSVTDNSTGDENSTVGTVCVSGLAPGNYTVNETSPPPGYGPAPETNQTATVVNGTNCTTNPPTAANTATFTDPPLSDIQVNFRDGGSGTTSGTITCDNTTGTASDTPATGWDTSHTVTGVNAPTTIHCTITIDP
jgi:Prealbumin-like fold domain